jgi:hypothetical protein
MSDFIHKLMQRSSSYFRLVFGHEISEYPSETQFFLSYSQSRTNLFSVLHFIIRSYRFSLTTQAITIPTTHDCMWRNTRITNKVTKILCNRIFCIYYYVYRCPLKFGLNCKGWESKSTILQTPEVICSIVLVRTDITCDHRTNCT